MTNKKSTRIKTKANEKVVYTRTTTSGIPFFKLSQIATNVVRSPPNNNMTIGISLSKTNQEKT